MEEYGFKFADEERQHIVYKDFTGESLEISDSSLSKELVADEDHEYVELRMDKEEFQGLGDTEAEQESLAREIDALNNSGHYQAIELDTNYDRNGLVVLAGFTQDRESLFEFTKETDFYHHSY